MHFSEINFGFPLWKLQLFMFPPGFLLNFLWIARQSMWQFLAPCLKTINLPTKNHLGRTALVFWYGNSIILPKSICYRKLWVIKFLSEWYIKTDTEGPHLIRFLGPGKNAGEICTSWVVHTVNSTSKNSLIRSPTSNVLFTLNQTTSLT